MSIMAIDNALSGDAYRAQLREFYHRLKLCPPVEGERLAQLRKVVEKNIWLATGAYAEDDPLFEAEYQLNIVETYDLDLLIDYFAHGNWALRDGIVFGDLCFIQQVNGGDEWATFKFDHENNTWDIGTRLGSFESISFGHMIDRDDDCASLIIQMQMATPEQCRKLEYKRHEDTPHGITWEPAHICGYASGPSWRVWNGRFDAGEARFEIHERGENLACLVKVKPSPTISADAMKALEKVCGNTSALAALDPVCVGGFWCQDAKAAATACESMAQEIEQELEKLRDEEEMER